MELFAADGHDAGGCERVTGKSGMRPHRPVSGAGGLVALLPGHRHADRDAAARRAARCAAVSDGAGADGVSGAGTQGGTQTGSVIAASRSRRRATPWRGGWWWKRRGTIGTGPASAGRSPSGGGGQPPRVIALADKAQQRLCRRFRRLAEHKPGPVVTVAVARQLVGFLWAALHPERA